MGSCASVDRHDDEDATTGLEVKKTVDTSDVPIEIVDENKKPAAKPAPAAKPRETKGHPQRRAREAAAAKAAEEKAALEQLKRDKAAVVIQGSAHRMLARAAKQRAEQEAEAARRRALEESAAVAEAERVAREAAALAKAQEEELAAAKAALDANEKALARSRRETESHFSHAAYDEGSHSAAAKIQKQFRSTHSLALGPKGPSSADIKKSMSEEAYSEVMKGVGARPVLSEALFEDKVDELRMRMPAASSDELRKLLKAADGDVEAALRAAKQAS